MTLTNFNLFPNKYKKEDKHPDWKISAKDEHGQYQEIGAGWNKESNGQRHISCRLDTNPRPVKNELTEEETRIIREAREREARGQLTVSDDIDGEGIPF